jgi:hypothetical protein
MDTLFVGADGLHCALRIYPSTVMFVNLQDLGWNWIDFPALARRPSLLPAAFCLLRPQMIEEAFAILYDVCIQVDQRAELIGDSIGDTADDPTGIRMAAEDHVGKFFPVNKVDDVRDMGGKIDRRRSEMAPLA